MPKENICKRMFKPENLKNSWNSFANNLMDTFGKRITVREEREIKLQEMIEKTKKAREEEMKQRDETEREAAIKHSE